MYVSPEQIAANNKAGMETLLGLASAQFAVYERLSSLTFNTAKAAFEDNINTAKALFAAKDPQEWMSVSAAAAQPALEKAIAFSRSVYEVATQSQGEVNKAVEAQAAEFNKNVVGFLDKYSKNAPAGSDVAVAAVKSVLSAANTAYDNLNRVAKQASEYAESNFAAATSSVKEARRKAA